MLAVALILVLGGSAMGQQFDAATDQELLAAYCTAVFAQNIKALAGRPMTATTQRLETKRARFYDYMISRGLYSNRRSKAASEGTNIAAAHGATDWTMCSRQSQACSERCPPGSEKDAAEVFECLTTCEKAEPACARVDRCWDADRNLPF